jgi:acetamidase/formamidase
MAEHQLDSSEIHRRWNRTLPPRLTIDSGDSVRIEVRQGVDGYCDRDSKASDLPGPYPGHPLTGPIAIRGASPGDVLEVHVESIEVADWGMTFTGPGFGLLPEDFTEPALLLWEIADGRATCLPGIEVPVSPFCGVMGCAPDQAGQLSTIPPRHVGGNLDCKSLTAGATLWVPVELPGALFSVGDAHAAQGDGEVGGTAIETGFPEVVLRFELHQDRTIDAPEYRRGSTPAALEQSGWFVTTGVEDNLLTASRQAVRRMIGHLHSERGLSRQDAYMLCAVAVDLRISEVVNDGTYVVSAMLPDAIFVS